MERITDDIFISSNSKLALVTAHNKIKFTIDISGISKHVDSGIEFDEVLPIADSDKGNNPEQFMKILKAIDKAVKENKTPILIMCHAGVSRSPTIVALYLFYSKQFDSFDEALEFVRNRSKAFQPNLDLVDFIKREVIPLIKI